MANTSAIFEGSRTKLLTEDGLALEAGQSIKVTDGAAEEAVMTSDATGVTTLQQSSKIADQHQTGLVSWGGAGAYYSKSGANLSILRPGVGRINGTKITWAGGESVGMTANKSYYVGYTATNTLTAVDASTVYSSNPFTFEANLLSLYDSMVVLYEVWYNGFEILISKEDHPYSYPTHVSVADHFRLGAVYTGTGGVIRLLSSANRTIDSLGVDQISDHGLFTEVPDSATVALSLVCVFKNAGGIGARFARRKFTVSGVTVNPTEGATYTNNGSTFTVMYANIVAGSGTIETWMSTPVADPTASGNLTKASGTGDASIAFSSWTTNRVVPTQYINAGVVTNLGTSGATRYSITAIYALKDTKNTATIQYIGVPSNTTYSSTASAANSIGTTTVPDVTQFVMPGEVSVLEPVLTGFVLSDGSGRIIPNVTTNGFVAGVRSFKATSGSSASAGNVAVANAVNVSTSTTNFNGILSTVDVNVQQALDSIDDYMALINVSSNVTLTRNRVHLVDTSSARSLTLPAPVAGHSCKIVIKDATGSADTNNITIVRSGTEKIETVAASYVYSTPLGSITLFDNGTDWFII